jgi:hypothetical protein
MEQETVSTAAIHVLAIPSVTISVTNKTIGVLALLVPLVMMAHSAMDEVLLNLSTRSHTCLWDNRYNA